MFNNLCIAKTNLLIELEWYQKMFYHLLQRLNVNRMHYLPIRRNNNARKQFGRNNYVVAVEILNGHNLTRNCQNLANMIGANVGQPNIDTKAELQIAADLSNDNLS